MLTITIPETEFFDNERQMFITKDSVTVRMEHSLVAISKWESKWHRPFLVRNGQTGEGVLDYFRMMCLDEDVDLECFDRLSEENVQDIQEYMENVMTATTFSDLPGKTNHEIVTAEIIYYWMVALQIPLDRENWHFGRLIALIKTVNAKNAPKKKMNTKDALAQQRQLNMERRALANSSG